MTENEKKLLIGLSGVIAFIATAVTALWTSWTCLGDTKQVIVLVTITAAVPALLFAWFWNRKTWATTVGHAIAYEKLTRKSYWNPHRTIRLTASGETILLLTDADSGIAVGVNVHNRCPLALELGTLTLTSWTLEDEAGTPLFQGTGFQSNDFATESVPPGEGSSKTLRLPVQRALPKDGPLGGVRFRCDISLMYTVEGWGPNTVTSACSFQSLVKDLRTVTLEPAAKPDPFPSLDSLTVLRGTLPSGKPWTITTPLRRILNVLLTNLLKPNFEDSVRNDFANALAKRAGQGIGFGHAPLVKIDDSDFNSIRAQLMARGFIHLGNQVTSQGMAVFWQLTESGRQFQVEETLRVSEHPPTTVT